MRTFFTVLLIANFVSGFSQFGEEQILTYSYCNSPFSTFSADLDGDGDLDALATGNTNNSVYWFENTGPGSFGPPQLIYKGAINNGAKSIFATDLDGDSDIDIIYSGILNIGWFENEGDGTFSDKIIITEDVLDCWTIYADDIDGDGDSDLVSGSYSDDKIYWYENIGDGTFETAEVVSSSANGVSNVWIVDLDGDGNKDILSSLYLDNAIAWNKNLGDGSFSPITLLTTDLTLAFQIRIWDFDMDGDFDIIGSSPTEGVGKIENLGGGLFGALEPILDTTGATGLAVKDLNGDGNVDLITSLHAHDKIVWLEGHGDGTFGGAETVLDSIINGNYIVLSDFDADMDQDILVCSESSDIVGWCKNLGAGAFSELIYLTPKTASMPQFITTQDLDGDSDLDILSASIRDHKIAWYENLGDGLFTEPIPISTTAKGAYMIRCSDIELDGDQDIVACISEEDKVVWYENMGDGSFGNAQTITTEADNVRSIFLADINGDGYVDVLSASLGDDKLAWYENMGDGSFGPQEIISAGVAGSSSVYAADLDGDGDLDVICTSPEDNKVIWFENMGDLGFGSEEVITTEAMGASIANAADLDGDGDQDVLSLSTIDNKIAWYENLGDGSFGEEQLLVISAVPVYVLTSADIDLDGDQDVISAVGEDRKLTWFQNNGEGEFTPPIEFTSEIKNPSSIHIANIGGDEYPEIMATRRGLEDKISWSQNYLSPYEVTGELYIDLNENAVRDESEPGMSLIQVLSDPENTFSYTYPDGEYIMNFDESLDTIYDVFPESLDNWGLTTDSTSYSILVDPYFEPEDSLDFGFYPAIFVDSLITELVGGFPRCNSEINYWIDIRNVGTTVPSGLIHVELDDSISYISATIEPDSIIGQSIYWYYDSLFYFSNEMIGMVVLMPDFLSVGDTLTSILTVTADSLDDIVFENSSTLNQILVCSYDPNDKKATPIGYGEPGYISPDLEQLEYLIRFQNTGTDTAITVVIKDQLDSSLNWNSFVPISSSHEMSVDVDYSGLITFSFENIMLPDSSTNELASHGYIKYKIELKDDLPLGSDIVNFADIYFDANPPVETNLTIHTIFDCAMIFNDLDYSSVTCRNDSVFGVVPFDSFTTEILWEILDNEEIGDSLSWLPDTSGTFDLIIYSSNALCEIDTTVSVTIYPSYTDSVFEAEICPGDSVLIEDTYQTTSGFYGDSLISIHGCDSIVGRVVIVNELPFVSFSEPEDDVVCLESAVVILSGTPYGGVFTGSGVSENEFNPEIAGIGEHLLYYTYEDDNGCSNIDSVRIMVVDCLGIEENLTEIFKIYPNPFDDFTTVYLENAPSEPYSIIIHDMLGKEVYRFKDIQENSVKIWKKDLGGKGVFLLSIIDENSNEIGAIKLIVE